MTDFRIDHADVAAYGEHFANEAQKLLGASPLVDIGALIGIVRKATDAVGAEMSKATGKRSDLRAGRMSVESAAPDLRDVIERFHHHLGSLPEEGGVDVAAFFPGGKLGKLSGLKPSDLRAKADKVLAGFDVPANAAVAGLASWKAELKGARDALVAALAGKGSARGDSIVTTAALAAAHERFVTVYNGVAKPLVRGVLNELGRGEELPLYFLDLQVADTGAKPKPAPPKPPAPANGAP